MNLILQAVNDIPTEQIEHLAGLSGASNIEQIDALAWRMQDAKAAY